MFSAYQLEATQVAASKAACATCHPEQAATQPHTPMGMALQLPSNQKVLEAHPKLLFEKAGFVYTIVRTGDLSTYTVTDGKQTLALPIQYAFGAGMQTYMLEYEGNLYESLVSYYPTLGGLSVTMGDETLEPHTLEEAIGRKLAQPEIVACFGCHTTGPALKGPPEADSFQPGLTCEHCHVGAQAHAEALVHGRSGVLPKKLRGMDAEDTSRFCGTCHRTFDTAVRMRLFGEVNVRFQPYRLAKSRCFNGADPRISCTACHDPHRDLVTDDQAYDPKCLACHSNPVGVHKVLVARVSEETPNRCPVANSNCVSCHMPKTELPGSHTQFTDHMIRVVKPNQPYPE